MTLTGSFSLSTDFPTSKPTPKESKLNSLILYLGNQWNNLTKLNHKPGLTHHQKLIKRILKLNRKLNDNII